MARKREFQSVTSTNDRKKEYRIWDTQRKSHNI